MADLEALLWGLARTADVPGAVLARLHQGRHEVACFGVTSLENPLPVDASTLFQVGSISKTFTATACARLAERGDLDLDTPIRDHLPDFQVADRSVSEAVTARMLLTHCGGFLGDYFPDTGAGDGALARALAELADLPQLTPMGAVRSYANTGFVVLGRLLEVITGKPAEAAIGELVMEPAGLANTWFFADDVMTRRFVCGHLYDWHPQAHRLARPWGLPRANNAVGGVVSCAGDLLLYARHHLAADAVLAGMREPQPPLGERWRSGLAWFLREVDGVAVAEHGGTTLGQTSWLALVPDRGYAVAVLTNSSRGPEVFRPAVRSLLEEDLGLADPDPDLITVEPDRLAALAGTYRAPLADYDFSVDGENLVMTHRPRGGFPTPTAPPAPALPAVRAAFCAADRLAFLDRPLAGTFADVHWNGEQADWVRIGSRVCGRA